MKTGQGSKTKMQNLKTIVMLCAWMLEHDLGAIKC